jgi:hypothetical protein
LKGNFNRNSPHQIVRNIVLLWSVSWDLRHSPTCSATAFLMLSEQSLLAHWDLPKHSGRNVFQILLIFSSIYNDDHQVFLGVHYIKPQWLYQVIDFLDWPIKCILYCILFTLSLNLSPRRQLFISKTLNGCYMRIERCTLPMMITESLKWKNEQ